MAKKKIKVLFFIAGMKATEAEEAAMNKFTARHTICVRNAAYVGDNDGVEDFDEVAGEVPPVYAEAAKLKPKPKKEPTPPPVDPKTVSEKSPAAPTPTPTPVLGQEGAPTGAEGNQGGEQPPAGAEGAPAPVEGEQTPPAADSDAKPVTPEPKPGAGKGWKPNA